MAGTIIPARNEAWLNAGPSAWLVFSGDNSDIKFPHRLPIIDETHEVPEYDAKRLSACTKADELSMTYDLQAGQAMAAGLFWQLLNE